VIMIDYRPTSEQSLMRASLSAFLTDHQSPQGDAGLRSYWKTLAETLGIQRLLLPEHLGGFGGHVRDGAIIAEEIGKALSPAPFTETIMLCANILERANNAAQIVEAVASGDCLLALAHSEIGARCNIASVSSTATRRGAGFALSGLKTCVAPSAADQIILSARTSGEERDKNGITLFLAPAASLKDAASYTCVDGGSALEVRLDNHYVDDAQVIGEVDHGYSLLAPAYERATIGACAEGVGVMSAMLQQTLEHVQTRKQFGKPLSALQAIRHGLVDMLLAIEKAQSLTQHAAIAFESAEIDFKATSAAKVAVNRALRFVSQSAVQFHGAIGTTQELPLSNYFKRATALSFAYGDTEHHLARYAAIMRP